MHRTTILDWSLIVAIKLYRRLLSPLKGFRCAHRQMHKGDTCSGAVLDIIREVGFVRGRSAINQRFIECNQAARALKSLPRGDLDCGLGGCFDFGGFDGCAIFDSSPAAADSSVGPGFCIAPCFWIPGGRTRAGQTTILSVFLLGLLIGGIALWYTYGSRITGIEITLKDGIEEATDRAIPGMPNSALPDYQIVMESGGREYKTDVLTDQSAMDNWLSFTLDHAPKRSDISRIEIVNKQLLGAETLDSIDLKDDATEGTSYRFRLIPRWRFW